MQNHREEVLKKIHATDRVLDVGGWCEVFPRANVVLDLNPYDTRRKFYLEEEQFTRDTWIQGDIHSSDVWAHFGDKEFDFVICAHLLEDIRDPLYVCQQMIRVGKAGYIECPSRIRECAKERAADPHAGYDHHRWIVDVMDDELNFTPKLGWAHHLDYLGEHRREFIRRFESQFIGVFWEGSFNYHERFPKGNLWESANLLYFYDSYDYKRPSFVFEISEGLKKARHQAGNLVFVDQFLLPLEMAPNDIQQRYLRLAKYMLNLHSSYEGFVDEADCSGVSGWAWSEIRPDECIEVDIYDDEILIDTIAANQFRQDVANHTGTHGKHGYSYILLAKLKDGKSHVIRVKFGGTNVELHYSPRVVLCTS